MATLFKNQDKEADIVEIVSAGPISGSRQIGQAAPIESLRFWAFTTAHEITIFEYMGVSYSIENASERFNITDIRPTNEPAKTFIAVQVL